MDLFERLATWWDHISDTLFEPPIKAKVKRRRVRRAERVVRIISGSGSINGRVNTLTREVASDAEEVRSLKEDLDSMARELKSRRARKEDTAKLEADMNQQAMLVGAATESLREAESALAELKKAAEMAEKFADQSRAEARISEIRDQRVLALSSLKKVKAEVLAGMKDLASAAMGGEGDSSEADLHKLQGEHDQLDGQMEAFTRALGDNAPAVRLSGAANRALQESLERAGISAPTEAVSDAPVETQEAEQKYNRAG